MTSLETKWSEHQEKYSDIVCLCNCKDCKTVGKKMGLIFVEQYGWASPTEIKNNKRLSDALYNGILITSKG